MKLREREFEEKAIELTISLKQGNSQVERENQRLKDEVAGLSRENQRLRDEVKFSDPSEGILLKKKCQSLEKERNTLQAEIEKLEDELPALKREVKRAEARDKEHGLDWKDLQGERNELRQQVGQMKAQAEKTLSAKNKLAEEVKILIKFIVGAERSKKLANLAGESVTGEARRAQKESVVFSEFDAGAPIDAFLNRCEADFLDSPGNGGQRPANEVSTVKMKGRRDARE